MSLPDEAITSRPIFVLYTSETRQEIDQGLIFDLEFEPGTRGCFLKKQHHVSMTSKKLIVNHIKL